MNNINVFLNNEAKNFLWGCDNIDEVEFWEYNHVSKWLNEEDVKCYVIFENHTIKSIALLSKMNFDPRGQHSNPYMLNFIYTFSQFRAQGLANNIVMAIRENEEVTVFCQNHESRDLFERAQYTFVGLDPIYHLNEMFVYP